MVNSVELMQLCRLCLVKDEVNIPIFDNETDVQQIFLKISTCLPVKVTQDDNLPKKICNDCSYKLDLCYQFWNTSANSEKQLVTWLNEVGLSQETLNEAKLQKTESNSTPGLVLKQETIEPESESSHEVVNNVSTESQEYILQQQQLPYQTPAFPFTDDNFVSGESANAGASKTHTNNKRESTLKRKRQAVATVTQPDSDDDVDEDIDDPTETKVAKTEETSDDDRDDDGLNDEESTEFAGVPSTSTDNEQPGPSGIGKNVVDAPLLKSALRRSSRLSVKQQKSGTPARSCSLCFDIFASLAEYKEHKKIHKTIADVALKHDNRIFDKSENILINSDEISEDSSQSSDGPYETESEYEVSENSIASNSDSDESQGNKKSISNKKNIRSPVTSSKEQLRSNQSIEMQNTSRETKINEYKCNYCNSMTNTTSELVEHLEKNHLNERCFRCTSCPENAFTFEELQNHFNNFHRNSSPVQMILTESFNFDSTDTGHSLKIISLNSLLVANATVTSENEETVNESSDRKKNDTTTIQCIHEKKIMKRNHVEIQNNQSVDTIEPGSNMITMSTNINKNFLSSNDEVNATNPNAKKSLCDKNIETNNFTNKEKEYKSNVSDYVAICSFCKMLFKLPLLLRDHLKAEHNKIGPFQCALCLKEFGNDYRNLNSHLKLKHASNISCYRCMNSKEELVFHRNEYHRTYCDICKKYYIILLSLHNVLHRQEQIKCTMHDKICNGKLSLAEHSEVNFPCSVCGKKFRRKDDVERHYELVHSEIETSLCQACGKDVNVNYLKPHLMTDGPGEITCCKICKKNI
ncbi:zinc finger and BTB domain-containing protein 41 isoform X5 [Agrilus planipennis]|uniref:Zinc finger and BTB domain-containing protein 41 isoform X5 n=1 Tax=Agrilus planipennis TaxID=224129 RepID=A0A1W4XGR8_AGRPL|nr:zinc finger and BTB domain-containing protein 41 isoform X5 [Agrilus planipennis]